MKMLFKIMIKLISFIACFLEFAGCVFTAMYSPSPFIESIQWILVPIMVITLIIAWYPHSSLYKTLRDRRIAERKAILERERRRQLRQEMWKNDYIEFYKEVHGKERNRF